MVAVKRNNFTFFWGALAVVLLPALVHSIPVGIVEQEVIKLDPLEEIVPEEPLPVEIVEEDSGALEENSRVVTLSTIIQLPIVSSLPAAKLDTPLVEEAPIHNLDIAVEHQTSDEIEREELINEIDCDEKSIIEKDGEAVQEKPIIKLLSQKPYKVTYDLNHPKPITTLSAVANLLRGDVINTVELQYSGYLTDYDYETLPVNLPVVEKVDEDLVPVSEEAITTTLPSEEKSSKFDRLKKKIDEDCNLAVKETTFRRDQEFCDYYHYYYDYYDYYYVQKLGEMSPEKKLLILQEAIKAIKYLELQENEPKVEDALPTVSLEGKLEPSSVDLVPTELPNFEVNDEIDQ